MHAANEPLSSLHWNVTLPTFVSVAWNPNTALVLTFVGLDGFESSVTAGATRSMVIVALSTATPVLALESVALTWS